MIGSFDSIVLAAVAADLEPLVGARVRGVLQPDEQEIALVLSVPGPATAIVCSIHPRWARVHLGPVAHRVEAGPFARMLRSRLEGARLVSVEQPLFERVLRLRFAGDSGAADLIAEIMGRHSNLIVVQEGIIAGALKPVSPQRSVRAVVAGRPYVPPPHPRPAPHELQRAQLDAILSGSTAPLARTLSSQLLGLSPTMARDLAIRAGGDPDAPATGATRLSAALWDVLAELGETVRRRTFDPVVYHLDGDVRGFAPFPLRQVTDLRPEHCATMSEAVQRAVARLGAEAVLEERGGQLRASVGAALTRVRHAVAALRRGLDEAAQSEAIRERGELLLAYASQIAPGASAATLPGYDGTPLTIPLDPRLSAVENAQRLFARYGKSRRARPALLERLRTVEDEQRYLEATLLMLDQASSPEDLVELAAELAAEGYMRRRGAARQQRAPRPRTFTLPGGATVLVGRSNHENDRLTFKVAGPDDLWLHARGVPGAHVILRTGQRRATPEEIQQAAAIAAYFSQARGSGAVAVDYAARRHVRKPRGSRPGAVTYRDEQTTHVAPALPQAG